MILKGMRLLAFVGLGLGSFGLEHFPFQEAQSASDAQSEAATELHCENSGLKPYIPRLAYHISLMSSLGGVRPCRVDTSVIDPVNGENTILDAICQNTHKGAQALISHPMPTLKVSGLFCTSQDRVEVSASGAETDNSSIDIAIVPPASRDQWDNSRQIDKAGQSKVLFGNDGLVSSQGVVDGQDFDGEINGEVAFGGTNVISGGSTFLLRVDLTKGFSKDNQQQFFYRFNVQ